jgi:hypothetical protein
VFDAYEILRAPDANRNGGIEELIHFGRDMNLHALSPCPQRWSSKPSALFIKARGFASELLLNDYPTIGAKEHPAFLPAQHRSR